MDDILIVATFLFLCLIIVSLAFKKGEYLAIDAILGLWLAVEFMDLNFMIGLIQLGLSLYLLVEGLTLVQ